MTENKAPKKTAKQKQVSTSPEVTPPTDTSSDGAQFPTLEFPPDSPIQGWRDSDGTLYLSKYDVLRIENLRHTIDMHKEAATARKLKADMVEQEGTRKSRNLRVNAVGYDKLREEAQEEYTKLLASLGEHYGVDFKEVGYDDLSGKLTPLLTEPEKPS